jgi:hypothetical protein
MKIHKTNAALRKRAKERAMGYPQPPDLLESILYNLTYLHVHVLGRAEYGNIIVEEVDAGSIQFKGRDIRSRL